MQKAIKELLKKPIKTRKDLDNAKREIARQFKVGVLLNSDILKTYRELLNKKAIAKNEDLEKILRKRAIRTMSGIAPVAVLTKPYPCPGQCAYCPTEKDVPQSYLSNEPAVMRAIRNNYNPYTQVQSRLTALENNGHNPNKIEVIVIGGTWSYFPAQYKYWYIMECFRAANDFSDKKNKKINLNANSSLKKLKEALEKEQKRNEKSNYKIIGLTLETRPDYINEKELVEMRHLGCTRVEIGVQSLDDNVLKLNKRGHGVKQTAAATKLLKHYGFKVTYHIMPALPGSDPKKDLMGFKKLFSDSDFQPDQIKFYPTVVVKGSLLYKWWQQGKYKPYSDSVLRNLIIKCKAFVPKYVRIIRLIRDIPGESIEAGNMITNLRQIMKDKGLKCNCIRCREPRDKKFNNKDLQLDVISYPASGGQEYFISYESKNGQTLYGFCRLRLPLESLRNNIVNKEFEFLNTSAIIRELHVYGELVPVGSVKKVQHSGVGKKLMKEAEKIVKQHNLAKIAVISGVGVREYYKKLGYKLKDTYMIKNI